MDVCWSCKCQLPLHLCRSFSCRTNRSTETPTRITLRSRSFTRISRCRLPIGRHKYTESVDQRNIFVRQRILFDKTRLQFVYLRHGMWFLLSGFDCIKKIHLDFSSYVRPGMHNIQPAGQMWPVTLLIWPARP